MKKTLTIIAMIGLSFNMMAQTYKDGQWYAIYDDATKSNVVVTSNICDYTDIPTPHTGELTFEYKKLASLSTNGKVEVYNNSSSNNNTYLVGSVSYSDNSKYKTCSTITPDPLANYLRFRNTGTGVQVRNIKLPLAKHILVADGSNELDFGNVQYDKTETKQLTVSLRSFLTDGDIVISSSNPEIFRIQSLENTSDYSFAVGANACAYSNGNGECSEGTLGNIANYGFDVYFCPTEEMEYEETITITDGTSTATVTLKGNGISLKTMGEYNAMVCPGDEVEIAENLYGKGEYTLTLTNHMGGDSILTLTVGEYETYLSDSIATIKQGETYFWNDVDYSTMEAGEYRDTIRMQSVNGCDSIETLQLTILAKTYGEYNAMVCEGEELDFMENLYGKGEYTLTLTNHMGGDSILSLIVGEYETYLSDSIATIKQGETYFWNDVDYSTMEEGEYRDTIRMQSVNGCDSIETLFLTIEKNTILPTAVEKNETEVKSEKLMYRGQIYIRRDETLFDIKGNRR